MSDRDPQEHVLGYGNQAVASADVATEDRVTDLDARDDGGDNRGGGGGGGGTAVKAPPAPPKNVPGPWPGPVHLNPTLAAKGSAIQSYVMDGIGKSFPNVRLALIDLTDPWDIVYVGRRDDDVVAIHSVAKLAILHAAFALRAAARSALPPIVAAVPADPLGTLDRAWTPAIRRAMLADDAVPDERPRLPAIFAPVGGDGSGLAFATAPTPADAKAGIAAFADRLRASIGSSNNLGSARCIRDIGFPYLNAANEKAGLRKGGKGLLLTLDFNGRARSKSGVGAQAGSARRLAEYMAMLHLGRLVDGASDEIRDLLGGYDGDRPKGLGSAIALGVFGLVPAAAAPPFSARAKVGYLGNDKLDYSEAALIRRPHNGRELVYAAALLKAKDADEAEIVGGLLDEAIRQRWP